MHEDASIEELKSQFKGGIVDISSFEMQKMIGKGGFGEVWKAIHKPTNTVCAVKKLFLQESDTDNESIELYVREVKILAQMKNLFCLRLLGFSIQQPFIIVTPFIQSGSLFDYVCSHSLKPPLEPTNLTLIAMGVSYGLMKLHEMGLIHRDLKSPNILLDQRLLPYICDFGIARQTGDRMTKDIGTTYWMAPEQMDSRHYDNKVDVYSYGCILYEMLAHKYPYQDCTSYKAAANIMSGKRPELPNHDPQICSLISKCWAQDPEKRPPMRNIFKAFCKLKFQFDNTQEKGILALISIICKNDPKLAPKIERWTNSAKDSKTSSKKTDSKQKSSSPKETEQPSEAKKDKHHHHHHHDKEKH